MWRFPGHSSSRFFSLSPDRRRRRKIVTAAVGISLALHVAAVVAFLAFGVDRTVPASGGGGDAEYVIVEGGEAEPAPSESGAEAGGNQPSAPAEPGSSASGGSGVARRASRRSSGTRAQAGGPRAQTPDAGGPPPAPVPDEKARADAALSAERKAFRAELRRRIKLGWRPAEVYQRIDPAGRLQGSLFTTKVKLRLRRDGSIINAGLAASSGIPAFDKEAMQAIAKLQPPPVPAGMGDFNGELTVDCDLSLDVGMFAFAAKIRAVVSGLWRPSPAFSSSSEQERITLIRMLLSRDGKLLETQVAQSAGIDFLDRAAKEAVPLGTNLPVPPPAFTREPGPARVLISFRHKQGVVGILIPREEMEED